MNESETQHLATKEDVANLRADFHKELRTQFYWIVAIQVALLGIAIGPIYFILSQLLSHLH
jgi:hypothetical protein